VTTPFNNGYSIKERIHYLEVPVSLAFDLGKDRKKGFFIPVGIYFAYGVGGKTIYKNNRTSATETGRVIFTNGVVTTPRGYYDLFVKRGDFGINFGLGHKVKNLLFDFTYNLGLTNIHPKQSASDKLIVKNLYLRFGATYMFKTKK
jgi:hypothetical protein